MYTSESGAKYRKARESKNRDNPESHAIYEKAKASNAARSKALEKKSHLGKLAESPKYKHANKKFDVKGYEDMMK